MVLNDYALMPKTMWITINNTIYDYHETARSMQLLSEKCHSKLSSCSNQNAKYGIQHTVQLTSM